MSLSGAGKTFFAVCAEVVRVVSLTPPLIFLAIKTLGPRLLLLLRVINNCGTLTTAHSLEETYIYCSPSSLRLAVQHVRHQSCYSHWSSFTVT